jgi:hypothetical protein
VCTALAAAVLCIGLVPATASAQQRSAAETGGLGAAAALCSLPYGPTKVVYALGGTIVAGFAWALSGGDNDVMRAVLNPAVRGDYVVTPAHLRGQETLEFIGREPEEQWVSDTGY